MGLDSNRNLEVPEARAKHTTQGRYSLGTRIRDNGWMMQREPQHLSADQNTILGQQQKSWWPELERQVQAVQANRSRATLQVTV